MTPLSAHTWPGATTVADPYGVRWTIWLQRTAWRPRSPAFFSSLKAEAATPDLAPRPWYERRRDRETAFLVDGLLLLGAGLLTLALETILLLVLSPPWLLARRIGGRPVVLQLYRDGRPSRTRRVARVSLDDHLRELVAEITAGSLDTPQEVYRRHRPWLSSPSAPRR
ncbi:MAG: hypothetical protein ACRCSN_15400 [Dermatophilaceae bacterium]